MPQQAPLPFRRHTPIGPAAADLPVEKGRTAADYEFQVLTVPRGTSIGAVRSTLADQSEYGRWELVRTRLYMGGGKKVWMRRRIIRVTSTLPADMG